jgi:hypothetical protein
LLTILKIQSNKIQRLTQWEIDNSLVIVAESDPSFEKPDDAQPKSEVEYPVEIRYFKFRTAWHCSDNNIHLDTLFSANTLAKLRTVTGCDFKTDSEQKLIYVGSHTQESFLAAIQKLNIIQKHYVSH